MPEEEINYALTQDDINSLADKLDKFGEGLSDKEQAVLVGVFAAASAQIESEADSDVQGYAANPAFAQSFAVGEVSRLAVGDSFKSSLSRFTPGGVAGVGGNPLAGDSVGVTGTIMF